MSNNAMICGDTHGEVFDRIHNLKKDTDLIILGDVGLNFYLNNRDREEKKKVNELGINIYALRGNHECRPEHLETIDKVWNDKINNYVYCELEFSRINYLIDGEIYQFGDYSALALGGAYSVDKYYRLNRATGDWCGWWEDEQLSAQEQNDILKKLIEEKPAVDFIFSHTCPLEYQPTDLFLSVVDQSTVDNSMERFLSKINKIVSYGIWLFGHYHQDRIERPYVEQFYMNIESLDDIHERWFGEDAKYLQAMKRKSPRYFYDKFDN